jgi:hypothetical protein
MLAHEAEDTHEGPRPLKRARCTSAPAVVGNALLPPPLERVHIGNGFVMEVDRKRGKRSREEDEEKHEMPPHLYADDTFTEELLGRMVTRELELRKEAAASGGAYEEAERSNVTDWMQVTARLQEQVVAEFGFTSPLGVGEAMRRLRNATVAHPALTALSIHQFNIARPVGTLAIGARLRDHPEKIPLRNVVREGGRFDGPLVMEAADVDAADVFQKGIDLVFGLSIS